MTGYQMTYMAGMVHHAWPSDTEQGVRYRGIWRTLRRMAGWS